jgi:uncharacterized membrane protein YdjX (TVP38/TMEM64 family)
MKKISKFLIIVIWGALIYILFRLNLLTGNIDNLNQFFNGCDSFKVLIFIGLSTFRIVALIPSAVFMILGGILFNPLKGILLTLISIILSETIVYLTSRILIGSNIQNYITNKYPKLYELLLKNNTRILAIGILCPVAPSDVACFLASSTGISYRKFILTVVISNMPMMILYGFLGNSFLSSGSNTIMLLGIIIIISIYSLYLWSKEQKIQKLA